MIRTGRFFIVTVAAMLCMSAAAFAASKKTCAVIADASARDNASEVATLLEAQLTSGGQLALVDRSRIDQVLREHQLQAALSPDAVAERSSLSRLLKADILVFIRSQHAPDRLEFVISESGQGLRLYRHAWPANIDAKDAAKQIAPFVEYAAALLGHIKEIC